MWKGGTFHFEHRLVLLSEGPADRRFFEKLIKDNGLPKFDFPWPVLPGEDTTEEARKLHGVDKIGTMLETLNSFFKFDPNLKENIRGVLIAVDAKDSPSDTFQVIKTQIAKAGSFAVPNAEFEVSVAGNGHPRIAVILLPGNGKPGSLETLYVKALSVRFKSTAKCVEKFLECGNIKVHDWNQEKQAKARLQCLVAATNADDPSKSAGYLLSWKGKDQKPMITMRQKCFGPIHKAVKAFCLEVNQEMIRGRKESHDESYPEPEAKRRFEAALRGARLASPQPMKEIPPKRTRATTKTLAQSKPKMP